MVRLETMRELELQMTIMCDRQEVRIEIDDPDAVLRIAEITIKAQDFVAMLGRIACQTAKGKVLVSDYIGKKREHKEFVFEMPNDYVGHKERLEVAIKRATQLCPDGWQPSLYFGSQNSFFVRDGKHFARTTIMRWVDKEVT